MPFMSDELDTDSEVNPTCHDSAAYLLPWYVNESLSAAEMRQVREHLQQCAVCRADVLAEQRVMQRMQSAEVVELAPQPGLQKLMTRVSADPESVEFPTRRPPVRRDASAVMRWLVAAVVIQAVGVGWLATKLWLRAESPAGMAPLFQTLTSRPVTSPTGHIRVMFTGQTSLQELRDLLSRSSLRIVYGPSESGLYTLHMDEAKDDDQQQTARLTQEKLTALRQDKRVLFAEPIVM